MGLDPTTGLYSNDPSLFPSGVFGGALSVNNAIIGRRLADEQENQRLLQQHLLELQADREGQLMADDAQKRQWEAEQHSQDTQFQQQIAQHPEWADDPNKLTMAAMQYGQEKAYSPTSSLAWHKEQADQHAQDQANKLAEAAEKRKTYKLDMYQKASDALDKQGVAGDQKADLLQKNFSDVVDPGVFEAMRAQSKMTPNAAAKVNELNARAGKDKALGNKAAAAPAKKDDSQKTLNDMDKEIDKLVIATKSSIAGMPPPVTVSRQIRDMKQKRDQFAKDHGLPTAYEPKVNTPEGQKSVAPPPTAPPGKVATGTTREFKTADEVIAAQKNKELTFDQAHKILVEKFGYTP